MKLIDRCKFCVAYQLHIISQIFTTHFAIFFYGHFLVNIIWFFLRCFWFFVAYCCNWCLKFVTLVCFTNLCVANNNFSCSDRINLIANEYLYLTQFNSVTKIPNKSIMSIKLFFIKNIISVKVRI